MRLFGRVPHWRRWWDLAQVSFAGWLLLVLLGGPDAVVGLTGLGAVARPLELVASWGLQTALASGLVGFVLLHAADERKPAVGGSSGK
ncbi:hypothetical protein HZS55_02220 [Halosimplex rubrum]|uniref:Uncharacterized protein n=1 Tax=Halosimplex rubrum TaxID=869889 RepID=A0A7D5TJS9_9EURY|nr:hypothetical protein [Halosimplex rubrum]QLH76192.1 hypothetical protein HZS55_02220 [Halosimplex rubrum]